MASPLAFPSQRPGHASGAEWGPPSLAHPFPALELGIFEITLQALEPTTLRGFIGPALRGLLGDAMLDAPVDAKGSASLQPGDLLHTIFKPIRQPEHRADPTPPFVVHPPADSILHLEPGDTLRFGLTLLNQALPSTMALIWSLFRYGERSVLERARRGHSLDTADPSQPGFSSLRRAFRLLEVVCDTPTGPRRLFDVRSGPLASCWDRTWGWTDSMLIDRRLRELEHPPHRIELCFTSPLHLLENGEPVRDLKFQHLVRALLRHVQAYSSPTGFERLTLQDDRDFLGRADAVRLVEDRRDWQNISRGSRTQNQRIPVEAPIGTLIFEGDLEPFLPLLTLGSTLHVGKARTGGFGAFTWRPAPRRSVSVRPRIEARSPENTCARPLIRSK